MYKLSRRSPRKKIPRIVKYLITFFLAYCLVSFAGSIFHLCKMNQDVARIQLQIAQLEDKNQQLHKKINEVQSDGYIEKVAREQLGLVRRNETLIITTSSPSKKPGVWKVDTSEGENTNSSRVTD